MRSLPSYLGDAWVSGDGKLAELVNPATEELLAGASSAGLDLGRALGHARDVGGPALRGLSFRERGELLEKLSRALHAERDPLIEIGIANGGNTRSDAKFDIDGATATLMSYAALGKQLGDRHLLTDGETVDIAG